MPPLRPDPRTTQPHTTAQNPTAQNPTPNQSEEDKKKANEEAARLEEERKKGNENANKPQEQVDNTQEMIRTQNAQAENQPRVSGGGDPNLHKDQLVKMGELKSDPPRRSFKNDNERKEYMEKFTNFMPDQDDPNVVTDPVLVVINWERRGTDLYLVPGELIDYSRFSQFNNKTVNDSTLNETQRRDFQTLIEKFNETYSDFSVTSPPKGADKDQEFTFKNVMIFNRHF